MQGKHLYLEVLGITTWETDLRENPNSALLSGTWEAEGF